MLVAPTVAQGCKVRNVAAVKVNQENLLGRDFQHSLRVINREVGVRSAARMARAAYKVDRQSLLDKGDTLRGEPPIVV